MDSGQTVLKRQCTNGPLKYEWVKLSSQDAETETGRKHKTVLQESHIWLKKYKQFDRRRMG